jgi:hypothetical protein
LPRHATRALAASAGTNKDEANDDDKKLRRSNMSVPAFLNSFAKRRHGNTEKIAASY